VREPQRREVRGGGVEAQVTALLGGAPGVGGELRAEALPGADEGPALVGGAERGVGLAREVADDDDVSVRERHARDMDALRFGHAAGRRGVRHQPLEVVLAGGHRRLALGRGRCEDRGADDHRPHHAQHHGLGHAGVRRTDADVHQAGAARHRGGRDEVSVDDGREHAQDAPEALPPGEVVVLLAAEVRLAIAVEVTAGRAALAVERPQNAQQLELIDGGLPHHVPGVKRIRRPEVAAGVRDAVVVEVARPAGRDTLHRQRGVHAGALESVQERVDGGRIVRRNDQPVPGGVDAARREPEARVVAGETEHLEARAAVAVPVEDHRERCGMGLPAAIGRRVFERLGDRTPERDATLADHRRPGVDVDLEALVVVLRVALRREAIAVDQEVRRGERAGDDVTDVFVAVEQALHVVPRDEGRDETQGAQQTLGVQHAGVGVGRLAGRARGAATGLDALRRPPGEELDLRREALGEPGERAPAIEAIADGMELTGRRLRAERPGEGHVAEPEGVR
jgi:hypothetical protein